MTRLVTQITVQQKMAELEQRIERLENKLAGVTSKDFAKEFDSIWEEMLQMFKRPWRVRGSR